MSQGDLTSNCMILCRFHSAMLSWLVHTKVKHITWLLRIRTYYLFPYDGKTLPTPRLFFLQPPLSPLLSFVPCIFMVFLFLPTFPSLKHFQYLSFLIFSIFTFFLCSVFLKDRRANTDFFPSATTGSQSEHLLHNNGMRPVSVLSSQAACRFRLMSLHRAILVSLSLPPRQIGTYFKNQ